MTATRTSEALSDDTYAVESVSWLRKTAAHHDAGVGMHTKYGAKLTAIADSLEAKDRAYADLLHLCANYKAESAELQAMLEVGCDICGGAHHNNQHGLIERLEVLAVRIVAKDERIRQLEALVSEIADEVHAQAGLRNEYQEWEPFDELIAKALAVPQEGNK